MKRAKEKRFYRRGLTILNLLLTIVALGLFTYYQFQYMDDFFLYAEKYSLIDVASQIKELDYKSDGFKSKISDIEANNSVYVEIYYPRDRLVYTTDSNKSVYEQNTPTDITELQPRVMKLMKQEIREDGSYFEIRQEFFTTAEYLVFGTFKGSDTGIEIYYPTDLIRDNANIASWAIFVLTVTTLILYMVISALISKIYVRPIERIKRTTQKMIKLDFNETCPPFKNRFMNELSDNINFLSDTLSKSLRELKSENRKLESDIENERRLEKTRRSFVANASHELKTPVSIIRGYAEGIKYGIDPDSTEEFCDIIIEETDKMNSLIARLMEQLQYSSINYIKESDFSIKEFIEELIGGRRLSFEECDITLELNLPESFTGRGDRELLGSVFNNYFSNALSHLDFERKIIITCTDVGKAYRVSVYNSGKPISGTDIENIWKSFYRADKSHSRKEGRFGLGLSIVASVQELHKEKYGVINKEKGVEFWFDIKKAE